MGRWARARDITIDIIMVPEKTRVFCFRGQRKNKIKLGGDWEWITSLDVEGRKGVDPLCLCVSVVVKRRRFASKANV